jgi:hypothetical protein
MGLGESMILVFEKGKKGDRFGLDNLVRKLLPKWRLGIVSLLNQLMLDRGRGWQLTCHSC